MRKLVLCAMLVLPQISWSMFHSVKPTPQARQALNFAVGVSFNAMGGSGVMVGKDLILTAKHVLFSVPGFNRDKSPNQFGLYLTRSDDHSISLNTNDYSIETLPKVAVQWQGDVDHPDLMLIRLGAKGVNFLKKVNPIKLAKKFNPSEISIGIGYGAQSLPLANSKMGEFSFGQVLIAADSLEKDNGLFLESRYVRVMKDPKTGTEAPTNLSMHLPGDSGGPLVQIEDGEYKLVGIVNSGLRMSIRTEGDETIIDMAQGLYSSVHSAYAQEWLKKYNFE